MDEMVCDRIDAEELVAARSFVYTLFQALFGSEPEEAELQVALNGSLAEAAQVFAEALEQQVPDDGFGLKSLASTLGEMADDLGQAQSEYARFFEGPASLPVKPWECAFLDETAPLISARTLAIRDTYRDQGFLPALYPRVADDHIALECAFMASLSKRMGSAGSRADDSFVEAAQASEDFLNNHLSRWLPAYADAVGACPEGNYYGRIARSAAMFVDFDRRLLAQMLTA